VTPLRVLIPEGSSLSAREAVAALGATGCLIDILDPDPYCICRFSRFVRKVYRSPRLSDAPREFESFLLSHITDHTYDLVLPVHEHAFMLSAISDEIRKHCAVAVAPFEAFERLQSKVQFFELASALHLPHPPTQVITSLAGFPLGKPMPYYVKTAFGTAGDGTWRVSSDAERTRVLEALPVRQSAGNLGPFLVQDIVPGKLEVAQSVFQNGKLVAIHGYRQQIGGVGGSASGRISLHRPEIVDSLRHLGESLSWHGALMLDYIFNDSTKEFWFIDPNPRLGETMNAVFAGVNLSQVMVRVSQGETVKWTDTKDGIRSHILLSALLAVAIENPSRWAVLREIVLAVRRGGHYADSREEVASIGKDFLSFLPTAVVAVRLLARPRAAQSIAARAIRNYALSEYAANAIEALRHSRHLTESESALVNQELAQ
jgi:predicted ATP-grasp superfamily ATP-dependent carboligase